METAEPPLAGKRARSVLRVVLAVETLAVAALAFWHNSVENALFLMLVMAGIPLLWLAAYCFFFKLRTGEVAICAVGELLLALQIGVWGYFLIYHAEDGLGLGIMLFLVGVLGQLTFLFLLLALQGWLAWHRRAAHTPHGEV